MFLHLSVPSSTLPDDRKDNTSVCPYCNRGSFGPAPRRHLRPRVVLVVVYGLLAISTVVGLVSLFSPNSSGFKIFDVSAPVSSRKPTLYSPFAEGVQYEIETTPSNYWHNDLYMGEPCNESEAAWNELIHPGRQHGVRLYRDEAAMLDINKSILLPDNNFAVILTVHHNLHCLRRLRQTFYEEQYYPDWTDEEREHNREHSLHCLESLRTSMICQPDLAPLPYYWSGNEWHSMNASPQVKRECVNWDVFSEYLKSRSYNKSDLVKDYE
ncbi:hypothetical protein ACMFMG_007944 [Clarireedia jacksonii]